MIRTYIYESTQVKKVILTYRTKILKYWEILTLRRLLYKQLKSLFNLNENSIRFIYNSILIKHATQHICNFDPMLLLLVSITLFGLYWIIWQDYKQNIVRKLLIVSFSHINSNVNRSCYNAGP